MKTKLKPCPFCGSEVELCKDRYGKFLIQCSKCQLFYGIELEDSVELIDGWRASIDSIDDITKMWNMRTES